MAQRGFLSAKDIMKRNAANLRATSSEPVPPDGLGMEAQSEWNRITDLLRQRKALDGLDQAALRDYLICWQRLQECEADIQKRGVLVRGARGTVKNPCLQIARQYRESLMSWSRELGLTIGSRSRLALPEQAAPKINKFAELDETEGSERGSKL